MAPRIKRNPASGSEDEIAVSQAGCPVRQYLEAMYVGDRYEYVRLRNIILAMGDAALAPLNTWLLTGNQREAREVFSILIAMNSGTARELAFAYLLSPVDARTWLWRKMAERFGETADAEMAMRLVKAWHETDDPETRFRLGGIMRSLSGGEVLNVMIGALAETEDPAFVALAEAVVFERSSPEMTALYKDILRREADSRMQERAAFGLAAEGRPDTCLFLADLAAGEDTLARLCAEALQQVKWPYSQATLRSIAEDTERPEHVRLAAIGAIAWQRSDYTARILERLSRTAEEPAVKIAAANAAAAARSASPLTDLARPRHNEVWY